MPLPQWTTRITDDEVGGEDHLGLEGAAQSYQQWLVPGIITTTDHARYYSFYSWILHRFIFDPASSRRIADFRGPYFRRHEVAYILGCFSHHANGSFLRGLVGGGINSYKARQMWQSSDPASLDANYFNNTLGGFGQYYRTAMQAMGLVTEPESSRWVYRLTSRGQLLAQAYEASIAHTTYLKELQTQGQLKELSHADAEEYGKAGCLCADALAHGSDLEPLRDAFFRFDQTNTANLHVRRRLTLGLVLDLVHQSAGKPVSQDLRRPLYLGEYAPDAPYEPLAALLSWYQRWRLVQVRHTFTTALQALWAAFLDYLRNDPDRGITFGEFMAWACSRLTPDLASMPVATYLDKLCSEAQLNADWQAAYGEYDGACRPPVAVDELTLYAEIIDQRRDPALSIRNPVRILLQLFLRWLPQHRQDAPSWREVARRPRLPLAQFFDDVLFHLDDPRWTVADLLEWLYREYIIGQHEFVALEKLRGQEYNTFKFYHRENGFAWAYNPANYQEPLRYPGLRLYNAYTILHDLGLVQELSDGGAQLTTDGISFLKQIEEAGHAD
jgi:hypothetical protein